MLRQEMITDNGFSISRGQTTGYGAFHQDLGCAKGAQIRCGCTKVAKFLLSAPFKCAHFICLSSFIFLLQTTENNSHDRRVYVKKTASKIFSRYIVVVLPAPRCVSGTHRKRSHVRLCHIWYSAVWPSPRGYLLFYLQTRQQFYKVNQATRTKCNLTIKNEQTILNSLGIKAPYFLQLYLVLAFLLLRL